VCCADDRPDYGFAFLTGLGGQMRLTKFVFLVYNNLTTMERKRKLPREEIISRNG
jgi:hypothetical protein